MAHDGILSGLWNAAVSGAFGTIVCAILFILVVTIGGSFRGLFGGLSGFTVSGAISLLVIIEQLIFYGITMGITGAVGGALSSKEKWDDKMDIIHDIDWKSLIIGSAISTTVVIIASNDHPMLYAATAVGLIYVGYKARTIKKGAILGAVASLPLVYLGTQGAFGALTNNMFDTNTLLIIMSLLILSVGALIGGIGGLGYKNRVKAIEEKERREKIGKNKKKK